MHNGTLATGYLLLRGAALAACCLGAVSARADTLAPRHLNHLEGVVQPLAEGSGITRDVGAIAVIEHDGSNYDRTAPNGLPNYAARAAVAQRFYQSHGDFYDFIVVFTNFPFQTGEAQAFHSLIRNDVRGIGRPVMDNGVLFGSPGRLKGYIDMADMDRWRHPGGAYSLRLGDPGFLATVNVLAHELGHQWLAEATFRDASGQVSSDLLGRDGAHWSYLLDSDASVMYGSDWVAQDGSFVAARTMSTYSALDLYLMGFLDGGKLPPFTLLRNPAIDGTQMPELDAIVDAVAETVTIDQVVAAMGPRHPDHRASPKEFRVGFVFLTRPGTEPDPADLAAVDIVREYFAAHFFALTRGVALADTTLAETPAVGAPAPDLDLALSWLIAQQHADGSWQDSSSTAIRDTAVVLDALATVGRTDQPYQEGLTWLEGTQPRSADFTWRRARVLSATAALRNAVVAGQGADGGFGFAPDFASDALDTALALRALSRLKQPVGSAVRRAVSALATLQRPTGGWALVDGGKASAVATAEALLALQDWATLPEAQALMAPGLAALLASRNPDGGFGESASTPYGTALALEVLLRASAPADTINAAVTWLQARQTSDGSWEGSPYETALVLAALRGGLAPNLVVPADGLTLEPEPPLKEGTLLQVSARVRNVGRQPSPATQARLYDGAPGLAAAVADAPVPPLEPGMDTLVQFDLPTTDRAGDRTLYVVADPDGVVTEAREDDNAVSRAVKIRGRLADLAIAAEDITVTPYPPEEGETVEVAVRVANRGERPSPVSLVRVVRGNPRGGGVLLGQAALQALGVGETAVVSVAWNTSGQLGEHTLYVVADPVFAVFETDETNNESSRAVRVTGTPQPGPDLEVALVTIAPPSLETLPTTVEVRAVVHNLGRDPAASEVALHEGQETVGGLQAVNLGPRSSATLTFPFTVNTPGNHTFRVRADPAGTLDETDETNNERTAVLVDPQNTVDLEIAPEDVATAPGDVVIGQMLVVTATVHNRGTSSVVDVPVVLRLAGAERTRASVSISSGTSALVTLRWTTSVSGEAVPLVVAVDPFGLLAELSEENNLVERVVRIAPSTLPNLQTSGADVEFDPDPPREGQPAMVSALVRNTSTTAAGSFVVRFYRGPENGGTPIGETSVPGLAPLASEQVPFNWSPVDARGTHGVFVVVDAHGDVPEYDEEDNQAFRPFSVLALPDLVLTAGQVALDPPYPRAGERISISATIRNFGQQPSGDVVLRVFSGEAAGTLELASVAVPEIPPDGSAVVTVAWTPASPGEKTLSLAVDANDVVRETDEGNNLALLRLLVQDADLFLTDVAFSPDGDGVRDQTTLGYRASAPVTVVVSNWTGKKVRTLAKDGPASGSIVWDGTDDHGRLQTDGTYTFTLEDGNGRALHRIQAFLDTNRESLHDAAGTGRIAVSNLTCGLPPQIEGPVFLPSEDEALFIVSASFGGPEFPPGLVRAGIDGQYDFVSRDPWYQGAVFPSPQAVAPDGREVLVGKDESLFAVDLLTGTRRAMAGGQRVFAAMWSPDGRFVATPDQVLTREGVVVAELPQNFSRGAWSPDSRWIASANRIGSRDGAIVRTIEGIGAGHAGNTLPFETAWRGDGRIASYVGLDCGDGCGSAAMFVIDPETDTASELAWLRLGPNSREQRIPAGWSADGTRLLFNLDRDGPRGSFVAGEDGLSPIQLLPRSLTLSPRGTVGWYDDQADPGRGCIGSSDLFGAFSLQNLTVGLRPSRLPANNGILVEATVSDRHLARYQLECATADQPDTWRPIGAASQVPIHDDVLTVWVPPSPGTYLLRLRAEDRAGNVRSRTRLVAWDRTPVLANITQTDTLISPNGDTVRDDVTFNYLVIEPTAVDVRIVGPMRANADEAAPPVVRRFRLEHSAVGPASFIWDGRDETGAVAPDGRYTLLLNDLPFRVSVDATPPDIAWSYEELRVEEGRLVADRLMRVADPLLEDWTVEGWFGGREQVYEPLRNEHGDVVFEDGVPRMLILGGSPVSRRIRVPTALATRNANELYNLGSEPGAVLTAGDHAGNRSTVAILPIEERLVLLAADAKQGPLAEDTVHKLPPHAGFTLAETIRGTPEAGESVRFQHQRREGGAWTEATPFALDREGSWAADLVNLGLVPGNEYRGRFVTHARGRDFVTQEFLFRPCTEALSLDLRLESYSQQTALWTLEVDTDVSEPLTSATLTVTGVGKLQGYRTVTPFILGQRNAVVTPLPSCATQPPGRLIFDVRVRAASDRVYEHDGQCRVLRRASEFCSSLDVEQVFEYCDGNPDVLSLQVRATSIADQATATIVRGDPPRTIAEWAVPFTVAVPQETALREDVAGVTAGALPVSGTLVSAEGQPMAAATLDAIVDRTPPAVEVVQPADGGLLCVSSDPVTGRDVANVFLEIDDPATDAEFAFADVEHLGGLFAGTRGEMRMACPAFQAPGVASFPPHCGNVAPDPAFPRVLTRRRAHLGWDVTGLPDGDYAVGATFCDRSGNRGTTRRRLSLVRQHAGPRLIGIQPEVFSPNGDGAADQAEIQVLLAQATALTVVIKPGRVLMRDVSVSGGERSITWDGRRDDGSVAPDGVYEVVVTGRDGCGREGGFTTRVIVDNTPPTVSIATPVAGQVVGVAVDVRGVADDPNMVAYELRFGAGATPAEWSVVGGRPAFTRAVPLADPRQLLARWDTPAAPGPYTLRLAAHDLALNHTEVLVPVEVRSRLYLAHFSATPDVFSPNGDARRESTSIAYELVGNGRVTLEVMTAAPTPGTLRRLETDIAHPPGLYAFAWDGMDDGGTPVVDGEYRVRIRVEEPGAVSGPQEESIPIVIDRVPPAVTVVSPAAEGFATRAGSVQGTVSDPMLSRYSATAFPATGDDPLTLSQGTRPAPDGNLGPLAALPDGRYTLFVRAEDVAENRTTVDVPFALDAVLPTVAIAQPVADAVLDSLGSAYGVIGTVTDEYLEGYTLAFGAGAEPAYFTPVAGGAVGGVGMPLGAWPLSNLPDGRYTLRLEALDRAGQRSELRRAVVVDGTRPEARIDVPAEGGYVTVGDITGSAADTNIASWALEAAPGAAAAAYQWSPVASGTADIRNGRLAMWDPLPSDGPHMLRLTVTDRAGHVSTVLRTMTVDRTPPSPPTGLTAAVERSDQATGLVRIAWSPNAERDLAGYRLYRDDTVVTPGVLTTTGYTDEDRPEGGYRYAVEALDLAGNVSSRTAVSVSLDLTPPLVDILAPRAGSSVSGAVEIRGTAYSADDFREYRLYVGSSADPGTWALLHRSTLPAAAGPLGSWTALGTGSRLLILEAEDISGNHARTTRAVVVDNEAPSPPVLTSVANEPEPNALTAIWSASTATDLSGYLVYRNGRVANAPALVLDSLRGFLVQALTYVDGDLPDGRHCYRVVAMDAADNFSAPSNEVCHTIDHQPPRADVVAPPSHTRFDYPLHIVAFTRDLDVASVRFQYRAEDDPAWHDLGPPDTRAPFETTLEPASLELGAYELRAVALDEGGRIDPNPSAILVVYGDATAPRRPEGLEAHVDGADVSLTWTAVGGAAGYHVFRDGERISIDAATLPSFADPDRAEGLRWYEVTAVDADGNESARSDAAHALVYKLTLDPPAFPVTAEDRIMLAGSGALSGATVELFDGDRVAGDTRAEGETFAIGAVSLTAGANSFRARATDTDGNRSIPSDEVVVILNRPPPPVSNLAVSVNGYDVDLAWSPVLEPDLFGYMVERGDTVLTKSSGLTGAPPVQTSPTGWGLTFPAAALVDRITLRFAAPVAAYRVEAAWEGRFIPIVSASNNSAAAVEHVLPTPFGTEALRVVIVSSEPEPTLSDVDISKIDVVPAGTTTRRDVPRDGIYEYRVAAIDRYGARGPAAAAAATVGDVISPGPPAGLAAVVDGSDVLLSWNASAEEDVARYAVIRDGSRIATTPVPTYRDGHRPNGTYQYRVTAVDLAHNESPQSDPVAATIATAMPAAPVLQGSLGPLGEVRLAWEHAGAADFAVYRGLTPGGPYGAHARTGGLRVYEDATAALGVRYHYVVRALDASGNLSQASNEVVLTPVRTAPLPAPEIRFPTDSAHPIEIATTQTAVQGRAPPKALVLLDVNETLVGIAQSRPAWMERLAVPAPGGWEPVISRNGRTVAFEVSGLDGSDVQVIDVSTGQTWMVRQPGYAYALRPAPSPDGRQVAVVAFDNSIAPNRSDLFVLDLESRTATTVEDAPAAQVGLAEWSPDGRHIAYFTISDTFPFATSLVVHDLSDGAAHVIAEETGWAPRRARWSPDGHRVAFTNASMELRVLDLAGGTAATIALGGDPSWSPDGRRLAFARMTPNNSRIVVHDLDTGQETQVTADDRLAFDPAFDGTGTRLAWAELKADVFEYATTVYEFSTARRVPVEPRPEFRAGMSSYPNQWLDDGRLAIRFNSPPGIGLFELDEGFFEFLDVALEAGVNAVVARAIDPVSEVVSADSEPVHVSVPETLYPDVSISAADVTFYPAAPLRGEPVIASAVVREMTELGVGEVRVEMTVVDPAGAVVRRQVVAVPEIAAQGHVTVSVSWNPARVGPHRLRVRVDPEGVLEELREDNNEAFREFEVVAARALVARLTSDREVYPARSAVRLDAVLLNGGSTVEGDARVTVEDVAGREVAIVDRRAVAMAYGAQTGYSLAWDTGTTFAGEYVFRLRVEDGDGDTVATAAQAFRILANVSVASRLQADRALVAEGQPVSFTARVENTSLNAALPDLVARFRVLREDTGEALVNVDKPLALLLPGGLWQGSFVWTSAMPSGAFRGTLTVLNAGQPVAASEAAFQVNPAVASFGGTLLLDPADVLQGDRFDAAVVLVNRSALPATGLLVAVEVRDGIGAAVLQRETLTLDLDPGDARSVMVSVATPAAGTYPVLLRVGTPPTTLARATLRVHGPITAPTVDAPPEGGRVATSHPELRVNNAISPENAPLLYEFQIYADDAMTVPLPGEAGIAEASSVTGWRVPSKLAEDSIYWWRARATDGFSSSAWTDVSSFIVDERNEPPIAPVPDRPEPNERVPSREPLLVVTNALDPELDVLTYEFRLAADPDLTAVVASVVNVGQGPAFTSWRVPAPLDEDVAYWWSARAFDGTNHSPWSVPVSFLVDTVDEAPTAPVPLRPLSGVHITVLSPELVVRNAADPEGRALTYRFEIDRAPTFDSGDLQVSPEIPETEHETAWTPSTPLRDDTRYHWRAGASDAHTLGPWAEAGFFVSVVNDPPAAPLPLAPADFQVVTTPTPTLRVRNPADLEGDPLTYEFEVRDEGGVVVATQTGVVEETLETSWSVSTSLAENGLFAWRTRARDADADGPWSATSHFRVNTVLDPPTAPSAIAPDEGAVLSGPSVVLVVSNATSPEGLVLTYEFELFRIGGGGAVTLVASTTGVPEDQPTSWSPLVDLADGSYSWRSRAHDGHQPGPWTESAHFSVVTDVPPAPPTGLSAMPGDSQVTLAWNANLEADVTGYRVHRADRSGGPYAHVATVAAPGFVDRGRPNGVTLYYVITATDTRFESGYSGEVAATPRAQDLVVEVRYHPDPVAGECLVRDPDDGDHDDDDDDHDDDDDGHRAYTDGDHDDDDSDHDDDDGDPSEDPNCPFWVYATVELPPGIDPASIDRATVRLAGAIAPDPRHSRIVDVDRDGIRERELRFRFDLLAPRLHTGTNTLSLSGRAGGLPFQGTGELTILDLAVDLWFTPRTLNKRSPGQSVQARITFRSGVRARDVKASSVRLNGIVPVARVLNVQDTRLTVRFDRDAVVAALPVGEHVPIAVSGSVKGIPFVARDVIRVID